MRDKTFDGTWSTHKFVNDWAVEINRSYDSFTEKGKCEWKYDRFFIYPDAYARRNHLKYDPYISKSNSIVFPHPKGYRYPTYQIRFDNAAPLQIAHKGAYERSDTTVIGIKKWSKYKRIRIRTVMGSNVDDLDINTKKLIEAIESFEKCKSFN